MREAPLPLDCVSKVGVCLFVVTDFVSIPLGLQQGVTLLLTYFDPQKCSFSPKTDQFEIVYGRGALDWGSQKLLIFAKNRPV